MNFELSTGAWHQNTYSKLKQSKRRARLIRMDETMRRMERTAHVKNHEDVA